MEFDIYLIFRIALNKMEMNGNDGNHNNGNNNNVHQG